ncbi:MAG TPA: SH3 domain-containing protein [Candidatus Kurthia intestinigallinarum]|nr:SH3 domain-containing protein [Candidatus Kurthia intestinigallinarum]
MGNFEFFDGPWTPYREIAEAAERMVYSDPNASMSKMRSFGEMMAQELWVRNKFPEAEGISQFERIRELEGNDMIDRQTTFYLHELRVKGNKAAHNAMYGTSDEAIALLSIAYQLSVWFMRIELDNPTFHARPFKKPMEHGEPSYALRKEAPAERKEKPVPKRAVKKAPEKQAPVEPILVEQAPKPQEPAPVKPKQTPKQEQPSPLRRKLSDVARAQEAEKPESVTTVKRAKSKPKSKPTSQEPASYTEWQFPTKWIVIGMFVIGAITASVSASSERMSDARVLLGEPKAAEKTVQKEQKRPAVLLAGDASFETNALRILRGDTESKQKIHTYSDLALTKKADKLQVRETYAIYKVRGDSYQLANGQYVSKKKVATTSMQDVPVYHASYSADTSYGTVEVQLVEPLNVRYSPSTDSEIVGVTYKGHRYQVYGQQGSWYRIGLDAWISANPEYVTFEKGSGQ